MNKKTFVSLVASFFAQATLTGEVRAEDWLGRVPDNTYVATLSIPGTHDTATSHDLGILYKDNSQCQDIKLNEQLDLGIRAFDFRPKVSGIGSGKYLNCNHGIATTKLRFDDALRSIRDFLNNHPTEFAICHILYANDYDKDKGDYVRLLNNLLDELGDCIIDFRRDLTVKDMRGKILLLYRDNHDDTPLTGGGIF